MPAFASAIPANPYGMLGWEKDAVMLAWTQRLTAASPSGKPPARPLLSSSRGGSPGRMRSRRSQLEKNKSSLKRQPARARGGTHQPFLHQSPPPFLPHLSILRAAPPRHHSEEPQPARFLLVPGLPPSPAPGFPSGITSWGGGQGRSGQCPPWRVPRAPGKPAGKRFL